MLICWKKPTAVFIPASRGMQRLKDIDAVWNSIRTQAQENGGLTLGDFYLAVQRALTLIRCDHTKAEISKDMRDYRRETPTYLPLKWQLVEGRGFVTGVSENSPLAMKDELLSIDGRPLGDVVAEVEPLIPVDGYATWARAGGVAQSLEFMGGAVDHFGALDLGCLAASNPCCPSL